MGFVVTCRGHRGADPGARRAHPAVPGGRAHGAVSARRANQLHSGVPLPQQRLLLQPRADQEVQHEAATRRQGHHVRGPRDRVERGLRDRLETGLVLLLLVVARLCYTNLYQGSRV